MSYFPPLSSPLSGLGASSPTHHRNDGSAGAPHHRRTISDVENSDMEALEKENFDLKLRLYYLEEKTKAGLHLPNQLYSSLMQNAEMQSALHAGEEELETKNGLLVKARSVIEALNTDMAQAKAAFVQERAHLNTEMNERVHSAMHAMESQLMAARSQAQDMQARKLQVDEEMSQLRLVLQQMEQGTANTAQENTHYALEIRSLAAQVAEKDALLTKQLEVLETLDREHQVRLNSALAALTERTVPKEEHASLQRSNDGLTDQLEALESQMTEWKGEIATREVSYKQTSEALHTALAQVDELHLVQSRLEESRALVHQLELQLQSTTQELEHTKETSTALVATQQAKFEQMLMEDDRRLSDAFQAERAALIETHAAALRNLEETNRSQFAELQDVYSRQLLEARLGHEQHLATMKAEFEGEMTREQTESRTLAQVLQTRLTELTRSTDEQLRRVQEEQEALCAAEQAAHATELNNLRMEIQESKHHLAQSQLTHAANLEAMRKDAAQLAQIEAIHQQRAEEKATETVATAQRDAQAQIDSARAKFEAQQTQLLASVEDQWREKEAQHTGEAERLQQALRVTRAQVDKLEASLANDHVPVTRHADLARREAHHRDEARHAKQRTIELQGELDRARLDSVPLAKLHEAEDARDRSERELQQLQRAQQYAPSRGSSASPSIGATSQQHGASPVLHLSMYPSTSTSTTTAAGATPPMSLDAFAAAPAIADLKPALRKLQSENRTLTLTVSTLKRRVAEAAREREEDLVERAELEEAKEEVESLLHRLKRREGDVRQLRDMLGVSQSSPQQQAHQRTVSSTQDGGLESVRELALGSGIAITSLSPSSPTISTASEASSPIGAGQEDLVHEVAKLTRALKARSSELAASQAKLRETKAALHSAQETLVDRAIVIDLETLVETLQREANTRESHISSLALQMQTTESALAEQHAAAARATDSLRVDLQQQLDAVQREAEEHLRRARVEYEHMAAERETEMATELQKLEHAHELAQERASNEFGSEAAETRHRLEEQLAVEKSQAVEAASRRLELETALSKSQARLGRCEEEKQRLELLVATLSQQMAELATATELGAVGDFAPLAEALTNAIEPAHSPASARRPPSQSPPRRRPSQSPSRTRGLFSPEAPLSSSRGRSRGTVDVQAIFQQSFFAPPTPYAGGIHSSPQQHMHSSLPMSPEHLAAGTVQSAGVAALTIAPHVTSITHSMQTIFEHANAAHDKLREMQEALDAVQQELEEQATAHSEELHAARTQYEHGQKDQSQSLSKEKESYFSELRSVRSQAERDVTRLEAEVERLHQAHQQSLESGSVDWRLREQDLTQSRDRLEQDLNAASRALDVRAREVETLKQALTAANDSLQSTAQRLDAIVASSKALDDTKAKLEQRILVLEASLASAPTAESMQQLNDRLHSAQIEYTRLEVTVDALNRRAQDADAGRAALITLRLAHSTLEQSHEKLAATQASEAEELRDLAHQLERARAFESENALLQQRVQQADRRTQVVGADQQLNVQVTRRVLMELCEVLHAAKIPSSGYTDASTSRTPAFLHGASFHYPDDCEQAVKWIKAKIHELQRVRRAFDYTIGEVEEKWKGNFQKLALLLDQRGNEIAVLQRRLLTALGQTATVTGQLKWK